MRGRQDSNLLREVAQGLLRTIEGLRGVASMELVEAEVEVPFVGIAAGDVASVGLQDFRDVSVLSKNVALSRASDIWKIRVSISKGHAAVLRVERYDTTTAS